MYPAINTNDIHAQKLSFDHIQFWSLQCKKDTDTNQLPRGVFRLLRAGALNAKVEVEKAWLLH